MEIGRVGVADDSRVGVEVARDADSEDAQDKANAGIASSANSHRIRMSSGMEPPSGRWDLALATATQSIAYQPQRRHRANPRR